ncbi:hypothetical protein ANN_07471, partial [Periplaneta americana]
NDLVTDVSTTALTGNSTGYEEEGEPDALTTLTVVLVVMAFTTLKFTGTIPHVLEDTPLINRQHIHFLHDGAPAHFSRTARRYLDRRFPDRRWIGRGGPIAWPPRSPDLNPLDFYLWGHLKSLVYSSPVPDLESLRNRIVACSEDIRNTPGVWDRVRRSMRHLCEVCIQAGGGILNIFCNDNDLRKEKRSGVFLSLVIFLSIAGNILVCVAIYTDRGLRRIGNLFLASLAIADLFVSSLVMTFAVVNDLLGYWMFGAQFCDTWIAFDVMCSTASILNLCAISLDRYIHIKDPLSVRLWVRPGKRHVLIRRFVRAVVETRSTIKDIKVDKLSVVSQMLQYLTRTQANTHDLAQNKTVPELDVACTRYGRWVTRKVAVGSIAGIWLLAALISFLPISLGLHRPPEPYVHQVGDTEYPTCALDLTPTYAVVSSCISFYFPTFVMLGIYCRLYLYAQKHVKNIRAVTRPLTASSATTNFGATLDSNSPTHNKIQVSSAI